jgi:hypothetical protein
MRLDGDAGASDGGLGGALGGTGLLGDEGGDELAGAELAGDDAALDIPEETPPEEPDTNLLAVPGKRDDDSNIKMAKRGDKNKIYTTTSNSKGKWHELSQDPSGKRALRRSMSSQAGSRNITGVPKGYNDLKRLSKGVYTEEQSNYDTQERELLEYNNEIKSLINEMEKKQNVE